MRRTSRIIVLTDIDGTLIPVRGSASEVRESVKSIIKLRTLGVPIVPVTGKTLKETIVCSKELGMGYNNGLLMIVEFGAAIYASPGTLITSSITRRGELEAIVLAEPLANIKDLLEKIVPPTCRDRVKIVTKCDLDEAMELIGLRTKRETELALKREFTEAVYAPDPVCKKEVKRRALALGLDVIEGRTLLYIGKGLGKDRAARKLIYSLPDTRLGKAITVALGDMPPDRGFLEQSDIAIIMPWKDGRVNLKLRRPDYIVAPYPAPQGWSWSVERVIIPLFH